MGQFLRSVLALLAGVLDNPTILGSGPSGRSGRTYLISGLENTGQETSVYQRRESESRMGTLAWPQRTAVFVEFCQHPPTRCYLTACIWKRALHCNE